MKRARLFFARFMAALFLAAPSGVFSARDCVEVPPIKPVHHICGLVLLEGDVRIANAKVTVLKGNKEIAMQVTKEDGKFSFDELKPGSYELHVRYEVAPFPIGAVTQVVLVHPETNSRSEIVVSLVNGGGCSGFSLVDAKKFEAKLNRTDAE
jgi:hypothetical protein